MKCIIFAGGAGTRLWPLSRKKSPKQFEKIVGDQSTIQLAASRLQPDVSWKDIYVSTGARYVPLVKEQLPQVPEDQVLGEPSMRDVGPAVGLITSILVKKNPNEPMVILWSDHLIRKDQLFRKLIMTAVKVVEKEPNRIVFISQKPRFASENLGWIEFGKTERTVEGIKFAEFKNFQYRPNKETAEKYFTSGHHAWNLGYFVTTPGFLWEQYKKFAPNLYSDLEKIAKTWGTSKFAKTMDEIYPQVEKISFDNAILEKLDTKVPLVISENIEWSDIGAWEALKEALQESEAHNVIQGKVLINDTKDSLVYNYTDQLLVTIDLEEMLVVNTGDVLMICKKTSVPKIKKLVENLAGTEHEHLT